MAYYFYFDKMLLPIPPEKMNIKVGGKNKTMSLINGQEINILKSQSLKEISFQFMIPHTKYPFATYSAGSLSANYYIERLKKLKKEKKTFQFIVVRMMPKGMPMFYTNITCSLEDFELIDDANNGLDQMVSVSLKEWVKYGTVIANIEKDADGNEKIVSKSNQRASSKEIPKTITVGTPISIGGINPTFEIGQGSLWDEIKLATGSDLDFQSILDKNGIINPNTVPVGTVISL
ncbi:MAG: hydrolase [Alphaproteobacteria bacterium]|nr:hydrolase [Alphaproteobacteria bacterium]